MLKIEDLKLSYAEKEILSGITLEVKKGEVIGLIGPSGCGKSSLLNSILLFEKPTGGKIFFEDTEITAPGTDIDKVRERIGMVFQNFNLFAHLSVIENVMSGLLHIKHMDPQAAYEKAYGLLQQVGIADKQYAYPDQLSGGQKQRAAIARTLAMDPEMILLDEPTSALDPAMKGEVEAVIRSLAAEGRTMIMVSHEMELISSVCTRVIFMKEGKILEEGTPEEILDHPKKEETRQFVKALRVLRFTVESKDFDFLAAQTQVTDFVFRNGISSELHMRLSSILEELFQMVIIQPKEENRMDIVLEFSRKEKSVTGTIRFSGPPVDPDDPMYFFSWPIIELRSSEIAVETIDEAPYTNRVTLLVAEQQKTRKKKQE